MKPEDQLSRKFEELDFSNEPAMASQPDDDVRRGERRLRRRRAGLVTAGVAAVAVVATSAAVVLPNVLQPSAQLQVAGGPDSTPSAPPLATPTISPSPETPVTPTGRATESPTSAAPDPFPYPETRQLLLDVAVDHLDPQWDHLPKQSTNAQTGGNGVGSKLDWAVAGEDGLGMVKVVVTTPDFETGDHGLESLMMDIGCADVDTGKATCEKQRIPGTSEQAWVGGGDDQVSQLSVLYERADGSFVGIGVYDLFGNNSTTPVSKVDVSLEQAFGFVTDPDLKVVPGDDAEGDLHRPK